MLENLIENRKDLNKVSGKFSENQDEMPKNFREKYQKSFVKFGVKFAHFKKQFLKL